VIGDWSNLRIFIRPGYTDMRPQIDGLARLVREEIKRNPLTRAKNLRLRSRAETNWRRHLRETGHASRQNLG
jgi:hypothetical protein